MNCHQSFASRLITIGFLFILSFALMPNSVFSQTAESETQSDLLIFVEEGALTIYNNAAIPISLEGFQLSISIKEGDIFSTSLSARFELESSNYFVFSGTCLIYRYDDNAIIPSNCNTDYTRESRVGPGDRFWYDENNERRLISVLRNNTTTHEFCPADLDICPIFFSKSNPDKLTLEPTPSEALPDIDSFEIRNIQPLNTLPSNSGAVTVIGWSNDGNFIVTGHGNGELCLWDARNTDTVDQLFCKRAHQEAVQSIDWQSGEQLRFASASNDGQIVIWHITESSDNEFDLQSEIEAKASRPGIKHLDWHPQNDQLLMVQDDQITIVDVNFADKQFIESYNLKVNKPKVANWRRDGRFIATISSAGVAFIMDSSRSDTFENVTLGSNFGDGIDIAWNLQFDSIVTADADNEIRLYEYVPIIPCDAKGCPYDTLALHLDTISDVEFSSNGRRLAIGLERTIHIVEAQPPYRRLAIHDIGNSLGGTSLSSLTWNPNGSKIAAGDDNGNIYIWDVQSEVKNRIEFISSFSVTSRSRAVGMAWDKLGRRIAVVDLDRILGIWNVATKELIDSSGAHTDTPISIDWNESRNTLATGGCGPMVNIWEQDTTKRVGAESDTKTVFCASSLDFKPIEDNIPVLAIADKRGTLRLWDTENLKQLKVQNSGSSFSDIEWDGDGLRIASTGEDGALRIFDVDSNYQMSESFVRQTNASLNSLAWSSDNQKIATASDDGWIAIWSLGSGNTGPGFTGGYLLEGHSDVVKSVSWSHVNDVLASVGNDNRLILWDTKTGQVLAQQVLNATPIEVKWTSSDSRLAVLDTAGQVTIWKFYESK